MLMKQNISISRLSIRIGLLFLLISVPQLLSAQEYSDSTYFIRDSFSIKPGGALLLSPLYLHPEMTNEYPLYSPKLYPPGQLDRLPDFSLQRTIYLPYHTNPSPLFRGDYLSGGILKQFTHGALFGSGGQTSLPGIGGINDASLGYQHAFNPKLALQLSANVMKLNMIHFTGQTLSASGALLYRPSEHVAFKVFGSYNIGNPYGMNTHRFGATVTVDMSERFSLEMGAQRYYDAMRGRWETVPVLIPYYRFEKFTLGLDVGGLVYEILREVVFDKQRNSGPTIAPPRFPLPIR